MASFSKGKGVLLRQNTSQALGALAAGSGIFVGTKPAILERYRILKSIVQATMRSQTTLEGTGLLLYLVNGDLSLVEAEAAIESEGPLGPNDRIGQEVAGRLVKLIGATPERGAGLNSVFSDMNTNSPVIVAKPRWTFARTKGWNFMVYNAGDTITTGSTIVLKADHFGIWVT